MTSWPAEFTPTEESLRDLGGYALLVLFGLLYRFFEYLKGPRESEWGRAHLEYTARRIRERATLEAGREGTDLPQPCRAGTCRLDD